MSVTETLSAALADRYTIDRLIGEGGMATVYLARDVRHNRPVALKVLRPDLGAVVGVDRFLAEIQVTANLQHPNLLPLFDSGTAGDQLFYVMPYVQGESLRARLEREKQLPVEEAIRLAIAIGGALDYAHRQGVIHRDLKPENVLLQEGQPLVADFGIALAVSNAGGTRITQTGLSLGTPHYMSPEQATGDRVIDGRTDIYSLGALAYEMLTGEPPHVGSTSQAIIARVLTERPRSIRASRPSVPEHVEAAVERALEKLPADRWATAREFTEALAGTRPVVRATTSATTAFTGSAPRRQFVRLGVREGVAWALAAGGIGLGWWAINRPNDPVPPMTRSILELPDTVVANGGFFAFAPSLALSRDGSLLAYVASRRLRGTMTSPPAIHIRDIAGSEARKLEGTDFSSNPVFSPDNQSLAYIDRNRAVRRIPVGGGPSQVLADSALFVSWGDNGSLYFSRIREIHELRPGDSQSRRIAVLDGATGIQSIGQLDVLPGSEFALIRIRTTSSDYYITTVNLKTGELGRFHLPGGSSRYVAPGLLLYQASANALSAVGFSVRTGSITGTPVPILQDVYGLSNAGLDFAVADNGLLVARTFVGERLGPTQLVRMDAHGSTSTIRKDEQRYDQPRLSPDGRQVVVRVGAGAYNTGDLWVLELASGALTRLTFGNKSYRPSWSRDGRKVIYIAGNPGTSKVMSKPWDGSGTDSVILDRADIAEFAEGPPGGWSAIRNYGSRDIFLIPTDSITAQPRIFVSGPSNETDIVISPSGRLLAYQSDETGQPEVYLRPVPGPGARVPVSINGGQRPVWSRDGRTLYYNRGSTVMAASIVQEPMVSVTRRDSLFEAPIATDALNLAVFPDGRGFLAALDPAQQVAAPFRLTLVTNWQSLLRRSQAAPKQ